ncbi:MAG: LysR family transcriptional regulator [Gracilibacteraceae bacterium]|nr:LysR family transcriptional regulator [Gracilibacteraceae bacterium]
MQIEQLQYLVEVGKSKSISQAAGRIYVSPQSLGSAIRALERECQPTGFQRARDGILPGASELPHRFHQQDPQGNFTGNPSG